MPCRQPVSRSLFVYALRTAYSQPHSRCASTNASKYLWHKYTLGDYQRAKAAGEPFEPTKDSFLPERPSPTLGLPSPSFQHLGILGGGITGLSTAYFARRLWPNLKVTIIEAKEECGGWIKSHAEQVTNSQGQTGKVIFEAGPRTLRATKHSQLTISLLRDLGLLGDIITTSKDSPAAQNRYIYYPDRLVRLPNPADGPASILMSCFKEPIVGKLALAVMTEVWKTRPEGSPADESIHSFLSRRLGRDVTEGLVSAVFHGIYAGDIRNLSAAQLLPALYNYELKQDSIILGILDTMILTKDKDNDNTKHIEQEKVNLFAEKHEELRSRMLRESIHVDFGADWHDDEDVGEAIGNEQRALEKVKDASVYTFKEGMQQLPDAMREALSEDTNVTFQTGLLSKEIFGGHKVKLICEKSGGASSASLPDDPEFEFDTVVDTTSCRIQQVKGSHFKFVPGSRPAETVLVVNLFYENPNVLPIRGFGYLLPSAVPADQNPENALGVVFDSESSKGQDELPGTKVTVMMGGHWWNSIKDDLAKDKESIESDGVSLARSVLERHLGIVEEPIHSRATLNENCIVQYRPFHRQRMRAYHEEIQEELFGRYRVAGMPYTGVGVNDCINSGFISAYFLYHDATGLEQFHED